MPASVIPQDGINSAPSSRLVRPTSCGGIGAPPLTKQRNDERSYVTRSAASQASSAKEAVPIVQVTRSRSRSEEHTSELQSLMRTSYAVFCLKKKKHKLKYRRQHIIKN